jgi:hypothetical protein
MRMHRPIETEGGWLKGYSIGVAVCLFGVGLFAGASLAGFGQAAPVAGLIGGIGLLYAAFWLQEQAKKRLRGRVSVRARIMTGGLILLPLILFWVAFVVRGWWEGPEFWVVAIIGTPLGLAALAESLGLIRPGGGR